MKSYSLPPDVLARGWANVWGAASLGQEGLEDAIVVEPMEHGVWLVGFSPTLVLASWCPSDPGMLHLVPSLRAEPVDQPYIVADADKRVGSLMAYLRKTWCRVNSQMPGMDDYVLLGPGVRDGAEATAEAGGVPSRAVRFTTQTERVDANVVDYTPPAWRPLIEAMGRGGRGEVTIGLEAMAALCCVTGCEPPKITMGAGAQARVVFKPSDGKYPPVLGFMAVGKREGSDDHETPPTRLIPQTADGGWADEKVGA